MVTKYSNKVASIYGRTDGSSPTTGQIGQVVSATFSPGPITTTAASIGSLLVPAGVWLLTAHTTWYGAGGGDATQLTTAIHTSAATISGTPGIDIGNAVVINGAPGGEGGGSVELIKPISIAVGTTYHLNCKTAAGATANGGVKGVLIAVRIA